MRVKKDINLEEAAKTVVKMNLERIATKNNKPYLLPRGRKIKDEKEVFITGPVQILHPSDLILLPVIEGGQV